MVFNSNLEFTKSIDLCFEILEDIQDRAWQESQPFSSSSNCWRAYLNQLCLKAFLPWLQEKYPNQVQLWQDKIYSPHFWEFVNGTAIALENQRLVIIPSDDIDADELRVFQEWVDIPSWVADYYLAVQVDTEKGILRIWGYTTHQKLKEQGKYNQRDRTYYLHKNDLIEDLNVLWVARQFCPEELTRSDVASIPALSLDRANQLLEQLGNPETAFPRRMVPFEEWGALLSHDNLRRMLYERRVSKHQTTSVNFSLGQTAVNVSQWLQNQIDTVLEEQSWTILPAPSLLLRSSISSTGEQLDNILVEIKKSTGVAIPHLAGRVYQDLNLTPPLRLYGITWQLPDSESEWALLLILGAIPGNLPPYGIKWQISDQTGILGEQELKADSNDAYLFSQIEGTYNEKFLVTIIWADEQVSIQFEFSPEQRI